MRHDIIVAHTQYSDRLGTVAAEHHFGNDERTFEDIFREAGLDFDVYRPIAYSFSIVENRTRHQEPNCNLIAHCVLNSEVGEDVEAAADPGLGLPIHRAYVSITPMEFAKLFKRLRITFVDKSKGDPTYGATSHSENIQDEIFLGEE